MCEAGTRPWEIDSPTVEEGSVRRRSPVVGVNWPTNDSSRTSGREKWKERSMGWRGMVHTVLRMLAPVRPNRLIVGEEKRGSGMTAKRVGAVTVVFVASRRDEMGPTGYRTATARGEKMRWIARRESRTAASSSRTG